MKINAESFLLDNKAPEINKNVFFITGNDESVINQVEKKVLEKLKKPGALEIHKTEQSSLLHADDLIDKQGSIFNETKACVHNNPKEINTEIFDRFESPSFPIIINSPKTKAGTKLKKFFDNHKTFFSISCYQITREFKKKAIQKFLSSKDIALEDNAFWFLIDSVSDNLEVLLSELEKISNYNKGVLEISDIRNLLSINENSNFDELFFSILAPRKKIILLSDFIISSSQDSFIFLNRYKFFFNMLFDAEIQKEGGLRNIDVYSFFPRYLFKYKKLFLDISKKLNSVKIIKINKILLKAEVLLKKNNDGYMSTVQRLLIKTKQIID